MEKKEILKYIENIILDYAKEKNKEYIVQYIDQYIDRKEEEKLYDNIYNYINRVQDMYMREHVAEYITDNNPLLNNGQTIFDKNEFIRGFYESNKDIAKSNNINICLSNILELLEKKLQLLPKDKLILKQIKTLKETMDRLEHIRDRDKVLKEEYVHCIRRSIPFLNLKLSEKICKMYVDVKKDEYIDEINYLEAKMCKSWKERLLDLLKLDKRVEKTPVYLENIKHISGNIEYDEIYYIAKELYDKNEWEGKTESDLKYILKKHKYEKVYVIIGNLGAGKTFFINNLIKKMANKAIILSISIYDLYEEDIDNVIIKKFVSVIEKKCGSVSEISDWTDKLNCKVCFLIENIQGLYNYNKKRFKDLIERIEEYTKYDRFSWVVTISEYDFYILKEYDHFLESYCFGDRRKEDSLVINAFNLNTYNDNHDIVNKILKTYGIQDVRCCDENAKLMREPLYAHIVGSYFKEHAVIELPETYYQLILEINNIIDMKIKDIDDDKIWELENKILENLGEKKEFYIEMGEVKQFKIQISELRAIQLLTVVEEMDDDIFSLNHMRKASKICIKMEIFWALKIVLFYEKKYEDDSLMIVTQLMKYDNELQILMISLYVTRLISYGKDIDIVLNLIFKRKKGAYVLFGIRNTDEAYDELLYDYMMQHTIKSDFQTTYALLYFIFHSRLSISKKIDLIIKNAQHIEERNLSDIYRNVMRHIAQDVFTLENLEKLFLKCTLCNTNTINRINGYILGKKYKELKKRNGRVPEKSIKELAVYIENNQEKLKEVLYRDKRRNSRNDSFIDYLIRAVFEYYIQEFGVMLIFEKCNECGVFSKRSSITKSFRRNFTCAAGNVFDSRKDDTFRKEYFKLVWKLGESKRNRFTALFLIINTLEKENYKETWDKRLEEPFLYLWKDGDVRKYFTNNNEIKWILKNQGSEIVE